eukprot:TRINITY_DN4868_c0_g1_i1.p1 TRINITY_DN4868_c0_g1~~TRINITY_DN4868_c0_g1_i1.p1  ORF type:complete len:351 (-),score=69.97 TRINITY_DN4868_c0_g1_i1:66-1088(-)
MDPAALNTPAEFRNEVKPRKAKSKQLIAQVEESAIDEPAVTEEDTVDHWKQPVFSRDELQGCLVEKSEFTVLFPGRLEYYLKQNWQKVVQALEPYGVEPVLDAKEGKLHVSTTDKTWDPYAIIKARDFIRLLARSVPVDQAKRIMQDDVTCDIIQIGKLVANKNVFQTRRARISGPQNKTLKALELLTECYVLVYGKTVACIGNHKGVLRVREFVEKTMKNVHPATLLKEMMAIRDLRTNPEMKDKDWTGFVPQRQKTGKAHRKLKKKKAGPYANSPFPAPRQPSKLDLQLESGEYWARSQGLLPKKREVQAPAAEGERKKKASESGLPSAKRSRQESGA